MPEQLFVCEVGPETLQTYSAACCSTLRLPSSCICSTLPDRLIEEKRSKRLYLAALDVLHVCVGGVGLLRASCKHIFNPPTRTDCGSDSRCAGWSYDVP